jgi:hypothetical protein
MSHVPAKLAIFLLDEIRRPVPAGGTYTPPDERAFKAVVRVVAAAEKLHRNTLGDEWRYTDEGEELILALEKLKEELNQ